MPATVTVVPGVAFAALAGNGWSPVWFCTGSATLLTGPPMMTASSALLALALDGMNLTITPIPHTSCSVPSSRVKPPPAPGPATGPAGLVAAAPVVAAAVGVPPPLPLPQAASSSGSTSARYRICRATAPPWLRASCRGRSLRVTPPR